MYCTYHGLSKDTHNRANLILPVGPFKDQKDNRMFSENLGIFSDPELTKNDRS